MFRAFFFRRPATPEYAATCSLPLWGRAGERAFRRQSFLNTLSAPIQALWLVALSLTLSHGREDGVAVRIKGSARKIGCAGCFLLFRRPEINGCKFKLLFKPPATVKSAATYSLPRGGGSGRGHSPSCGNLSQQLNHRNTSLAACCPLSSSLPRERGRAAVGIKGSAKKIGCAGCFLFFRRPAINSCKPKLLFKLPETAKSAATRSLPCEGGLGRGYSLKSQQSFPTP